MQETKNQALKSIEDMVAEMNSEVNIETLVKAKGFEECVAVISDEKCSIIVKSEGLTGRAGRADSRHCYQRIEAGGRRYQNPRKGRLIPRIY